MSAASLLLKHSQTLRNKACNDFLMGVLTGIADFERAGTQTEYTTLLREKLEYIYDRLERIEAAEILLADEIRSLPLELRLQTLWVEFYMSLEGCKPFLGDRRPMSGPWKALVRTQLFDLIEQIIMVFSPSIEEEEGPCLFE